MDDTEQDGVVDVRYALAPSAEGSAQQRRRVMKLDAVHLGADDFRQAVVRWRCGVEGSEREAGHPFVDLLRHERHVEEELRGRAAGQRRAPKAGR